MQGLTPAWKGELFTVGVTGTNGKTSTTRWTAACLARLARPVAQATTLGSFLDEEPLSTPKSWEGFLATMRAGLDRGGRFAAIELTSESLARGFAKAWPCEVGVFTNLTHDHLDAHGSPEHYLASKAQLFVHLPATGTAVLNGADPSSELIAEVLPRGVRVVRYGLASRRDAARTGALDLEAHDLRVAWDGTRFRLSRGGDGDVRIQAIGEIYAENALAALGAAMAAGVPLDEARAALGEVRPPAGRFEVVREHPHVVVDYAHTPDALGRTIAIARALLANARKGELWLVFGAGGDRDRKKRAPMGAAASAADHVLLTSDNPRHEDPRAICDDIREGLASGTRVELQLDREAAIRRAVASAGPDDIVLVAGKGHETEQIVGDTVRPFSDIEAARRARRDGSRDGRP